jgi:hypothetical protein
MQKTKLGLLAAAVALTVLPLGAQAAPAVASAISPADLFRPAPTAAQPLTVQRYLIPAQHWRHRRWRHGHWVYHSGPWVPPPPWYWSHHHHHHHDWHDHW